MDFVFRLHMITPLFQIAPFSLGNAVGLVAFTAGFGYLMGFVMGTIWNRFVVHSPYGATKLATQTSLRTTSSRQGRRKAALFLLNPWPLAGIVDSEE
jgi:hypothetical protein